MYEDKANAHVDTFIEPPIAVPLGVFRQTVETSLRALHVRSNLYLQLCRPFRGVGRSRLSYMGIAEPHFGKPQRTRTPFSYPYKIGVAFSKPNKAKLLHEHFMQGDAK